MMISESDSCDYAPAYREKETTKYRMKISYLPNFFAVHLLYRAASTRCYQTKIKTYALHFKSELHWLCLIQFFYKI